MRKSRFSLVGRTRGFLSHQAQRSYTRSLSDQPSRGGSRTLVIDVNMDHDRASKLLFILLQKNSTICSLV
jgi:hypothetical protein